MTDEYSGYPPLYEPQTDFSQQDFSKARLDPEFDAIAQRIAHIRALLAAIIREDWLLRDGLITKGALDPSLYALLLRGNQANAEPQSTVAGGIGDTLPGAEEGPGLFALVIDTETQLYYSNGVSWSLLGVLKPQGLEGYTDFPQASTLAAGLIPVATLDMLDTGQGSGAITANLWGTLRQQLLSWQFKVMPDDPPALSVRVAPGRIRNAAGIITTTEQVLGPVTPPISDLRIDRVVVDETTGVSEIVTGTPAASPVAPDIPLGKRALASFQVGTNTSEIGYAAIVDERTGIQSVSDALGYTPANRAGDTFTASTGIRPAVGDALLFLEALAAAATTYRRVEVTKPIDQPDRLRLRQKRISDGDTVDLVLDAALKSLTWPGSGAFAGQLTVDGDEVWHDGNRDTQALAKAAVNFNGATGPSIRSQYNVASVSRSGAGVYEIDFETPFQTDGYVVVFEASASVGGAKDVIGTVLSQTTTTVIIRFQDDAEVAQDVSICSMIAFDPPGVGA